MITVELSWPEVWFAASVGVMRRINALRHRRQEKYEDHPKASWNEDINGAIAECSTAKHYGMFWSGTVGRIDLPDVGPLEVRSKTKPQHRLVVRSRDDDDAKVYVSVLVEVPVCHLCGWMYGYDAKREEWLLADPNKPDRFFIPNEALRPMSELSRGMTWAVLAYAYAAVGYYHFHLTLRCVTDWDSAGTVVLNAALALTVGPLLLAPATVYGWLSR